LAGTSATFHGGIEGAAAHSLPVQFMGASLWPNKRSPILSNVHPGRGRLTASSSRCHGHIASNPAYPLVVAPPSIVSEPQEQHQVIGSTANFGVIVDGTAPFTYRWRKSGVMLVGATSRPGLKATSN